MGTHIFKLDNVYLSDKKIINHSLRKDDFKKIKNLIIDIVSKNGCCGIRDIIKYLEDDFNLKVDRNQVANMVYNLRKEGRLKSINNEIGTRSVKYYVDNEVRAEDKH